MPTTTRFLADIEMTESADQADAVELACLLLETSDEEHIAIGGDFFFGPEGGYVALLVVHWYRGRGGGHAACLRQRRGAVTPLSSLETVIEPPLIGCSREFTRLVSSATSKPSPRSGRFSPKDIQRTRENRQNILSSQCCSRSGTIRPASVHGMNCRRVAIVTFERSIF